MTGKVMNYFAGGNTAVGFYDLFESNLAGLDRLLILKGGPGNGKSTLMRKLAEEWSGKGYDIELIHCASDNDSLDGLIIRELGFGIVDGTAPHVIEPKAPGAIEEYVNLGLAWDTERLSEQREKIVDLQERIQSAFREAYEAYASALAVHDEWERIYMERMDYAKADQLANRLIADLIGEKNLDKKPAVRHRYLGAATPSGAVDFVGSLTEGLERRLFLKGRAGTGKSTLLKKIAAEAESRGFDTEVYHCGFDPNSLDMVTVRELGWTIFDSTAPHEYFPDRDGDETIDLYDIAVAPGTDEACRVQIANVEARYRLFMNEGKDCLAKAKRLHDELEDIYVQAVDFSVVDQIRGEINDEIKWRADMKNLKQQEEGPYGQS